MDAETVTSALRAASKVGSAAVVIVEVCDAIDDPSSSTFVFQRKTAGYPAARGVRRERRSVVIDVRVSTENGWISRGTLRRFAVFIWRQR